MIHRWLTQGKPRNDYPQREGSGASGREGGRDVFGKGHTGWGLLGTGCLLCPDLSSEHTDAHWIKID